MGIRINYLVERSVGVPADVVWQRLFSARRHSAAIPGTTVIVHDALGRGVDRFDVVGAHLSARTGRSRWALVDEMEVVAVSPPVEGVPGTARICKVGWPLRGCIDITVETCPGGTVVRWAQELIVPGIPPWASRYAAQLARAAYGRGLDRILSAP